MVNTCTCGESMNLSLRTVIYSGRVEIDNVPVFTCESCHRSEVYSAVKNDLSLLLEQIAGEDHGTGSIRFEEWSELALLLKKATAKELLEESLADLVEERINELLDLMLIAQSLNDTAWIDETRIRLRQITELHDLAGVDAKR